MDGIQLCVVTELPVSVDGHVNSDAKKNILLAITQKRATVLLLCQMLTDFQNSFTHRLTILVNLQ